MAIYHIKNGGNDSLDGLSYETAFETHEKAQSVAIPGDIIRSRRGDKFPVFDITVSGTELNPIQFDVYGDPELPLPVLTGYKELTDWVDIGSGLYKCTDSGLAERVNFLKVDGQMTTVAKWPKSQTYYQITGGSGSNSGSVSDSVNLSGRDFTGGEVVTKKEAWVIDRQKINSHSGSALNFTGGSSYSIRTGWGYFVQNHRDCIESDGDWCQEGNDIIMKSDLEPIGVKVPYVDRIWFNNADYVEIHNHRFEGLNGGSGTNNNEPAMLFNGSREFKIRNCEIEEIGNTLIHFEANDNSGFELSGCKIKNCLNIAFWNRYSTSTPSFRIENNTFENIGNVVGAGGNSDVGYSGIIFAGATNGGFIAGNRLKNIGYNGINFGGYDFLIEHNTVENACSIKDDGGCFYTYGKADIANPYDRTKRVVRNNYAFNSIGTNEGRPQWFDGTANPYANVEAYYLDDDSKEITLQNNVGIGCRTGTKHHNNQGIISTGNLFLGNKRTQVLFANNNLGTYKNRDITFTDNVLYAESDQKIIMIDTIDSSGGMPTDAGLIGTLDDNYYMRPSNEVSTIRVEKTGTGANTANYSLATWKSSGYGHDSNTEGTPTTSTEYEVAINDTLETIEYPLETKRLDVDGFAVNEPFNLNSFAFRLLLDDLGPVDPHEETYTVTATSMGNGSVTGGGIYEAGTTSELIAVPDEGYEFNYFENVTNDTVTTSNPYSFTVNQDTTVRAYFNAAIQTYSVTVTAGYGGTATGGGGEYQTGQTVAISAENSAWHVFRNWTIEGVVISDQQNYNYTVGNSDVTIQANFDEYWAVNLTATDGGTVSGGGMKFASDFPITAEASVSTGYYFSGWYNTADELVSTSAQYTFTPTDNNVQLEARFVEVEYSVEWEVSGSGTITELSSPPYNYGDKLRLQAIPTAGSSFTKWTLNGEDYSDQAVIEWTVNGDGEFVTIFEDIPTYSVTLQTVGNGTISDSNSPGPYREGKKLQYIADSNLGSRFVRWELNGVPVGNYHILDLTVETSDLTLTAIFEDIPEEELIYWRKYNTLGVYIGKEVIAPPINVPCNSIRDIMVGRDHVVSMDRVFDAVRINYRYAYERDATQSSNMIRNGNFTDMGYDSPIDWVRWGRTGAGADADRIDIAHFPVTGEHTEGIKTIITILNKADPRRELQYGIDIPVKVGDDLYLEWFERIHGGSRGGRYNGVYTIYLESNEREPSRGRDGGTLGVQRYFLGNNGVTSSADSERGQRHPDAVSYRKHDAQWSEERVYFMSWPDLLSRREDQYEENLHWVKVRVHLPEIPMNGNIFIRAHGAAELWRPGRGDYRPFPSFMPASGDWTLGTAFYQSKETHHLSITGFFLGVAVDPKSELVPADHSYVVFNDGEYSDRFEPIEIFNGDAIDPNHVSNIRVPTAGDEMLVWNTAADDYEPSSLGLITAYSIMDQYKEPYKMLDGVVAIRGVKFDSEITFESLPDHKFIVQRGTFSDYRLDGNFSGTLVQLAPRTDLDGGFDNGNTVEGRWIPTGNTRCRKSNRSGVNTGMVQREERNINPSSQTADQTRWVDTEEDLDACPIGEPSDYWFGADTSVLDTDNLEYAPVSVEDGGVTVPFSNPGGLYLYFLHRAGLGVIEQVYTPVQVQTISDWQYLSDVVIGGELYRVLRQNYPTGIYSAALLTFIFNS